MRYARPMSWNSASVAGGLLVAAPALQDPNFEQAVVLMCLHNEEGAMGLVINRAAPLTTLELMLQMGFECADDADPAQAVLIGGPVAIENGVLLYRCDPTASLRDDELPVTEELRLCPSQELLRAIAAGAGPQQFQLFLGHAGWAPGQLEQELAQGSWIPARADLALVFDTPIDQRWNEALATVGVSPAMLGTLRPQN